MLARNRGWRFLPLAALFSLLLAGCDGVLNPQGPNARDQYDLIVLSFVIMVIVMVVVYSLFFFVIIRYRKRKGQTGYPEQVEGSYKLELTWTIIPFILLIVLAVPSVMDTFVYAKDYTKDKDTMHVKVTAHQFWWEFEYPDLGIRTAQDLVIPAGKRVSLEITSADVTHSFWIPELAGKMDANPGLVNKMYFSADHEGVYKGKCAELCGSSHALMDFKVVAKSKADFDAWIEQLKTPASISADAKQGEEIFKKKQCIACHAITPDQIGTGPNLAGFGDRQVVAGFRPHTAEWIEKWVKNPQEVKPGTLMPNLGLTDDEAKQVAKYLLELK
ncbi:MAG TPA: cytochrome c oxidase subunit II [Bacilli bacterium]